MSNNMAKGNKEESSKIKSKGIQVYRQQGKYLEQYQNILDDFKTIHSFIQEAKGPEAYFLITGAQKKLTSSSIEECDSMIKDLILNFNESSISLFMEKTISLITSLETTNLLYGNMIDIQGIKKHISEKTTKLSVKRYKILYAEITKNRFIDDGKLRVLYENILLCKKLLTFANGIYKENTTAIKYNIKISQNLIDLGGKIGIDNYTKEIFSMEIRDYNNEIMEMENSSNIIDIEKSSRNKEKPKVESVINKKVIESTSLMLVSLNQTNTPDNIKESKLTNQFMKAADEVIINAKQNNSGDFISYAIQQFSSILSTIETMNYLKGDIIDYNLISQNISTQLSDLIYKNYTTMTISWDTLTNKSFEDYKIYLREVITYKDTLLKSYELNNENIEALKRYNEIAKKILLNKNNFKINESIQKKLKNEIDEFTIIIKKTEPGYEKTSSKNSTKEKKGFFSKLWK